MDNTMIRALTIEEVEKLCGGVTSLTDSSFDEDILKIEPLDISSLDISQLTINYPNTTGVTGSGGTSNVTMNNSYGTGTAYNWNNSPQIWTTTNTSQSALHVQGTANFDDDIKIKGVSILKLLEKIESRLAILQDPDPEKLEKFTALKKAYDNYKLMDKLIGDDYGDDEESTS